MDESSQEEKFEREVSQVQPKFSLQDSISVEEDSFQNLHISIRTSSANFVRWYVKKHGLVSKFTKGRTAPLSVRKFIVSLLYSFIDETIVPEMVADGVDPKVHALVDFPRRGRKKKAYDCQD